MSKMHVLFAAILVFALGTLSVPAQSADPQMSFFLVSSGPGNGADLGGLDGADRRCHLLARAVGAGDRTWRAYLSTTAAFGQEAVNARDRIRSGPWHNSKGVQIARDLDHLHSDNNNLTKQTQLNEQGPDDQRPGRQPQPPRYPDRFAVGWNGLFGAEDTTCRNWTATGMEVPGVGHHDRTGGGENPTSWHSAHGSRGCSQENLQDTGGDGLFYCFAID